MFKTRMVDYFGTYMVESRPTVQLQGRSFWKILSIKMVYYKYTMVVGSELPK